MERHAQQTLAFIKHGLLDALWTGIIVAVVKLAPLLLFGVKMFFKSVSPTAGASIFNQRQGLFRNDLDMQTLSDTLFASLNAAGVNGIPPADSQEPDDFSLDLDDGGDDASADVLNDIVDLDDDAAAVNDAAVTADERNENLARNAY